jgi:hypothetical protein
LSPKVLSSMILSLRFSSVFLFTFCFGAMVPATHALCGRCQTYTKDRAKAWRRRRSRACRARSASTQPKPSASTSRWTGTGVSHGAAAVCGARRPPPRDHPCRWNGTRGGRLWARHTLYVVHGNWHNGQVRLFDRRCDAVARRVRRGARCAREVDTSL